MTAEAGPLQVVVPGVTSDAYAADGAVLNYTVSLLIATVNAGATLVPAKPGYQYQLITAKAVAIGGAVTSVTTVDILGTQATSSVKLVAFTQAALAQSAVVTAGGTGGTVLADAASFLPCDVNKAITINITGSSITVATSVLVTLTYMAIKA